MSGKDAFLEDEKGKIGKTVAMVDDLLAKKDLSQYEVIALGTLLQNVYSGIEGIMRYQLQEIGIRLNKDENWHKNLLIQYRDHGMISDKQFEGLLELLLFRHLHIHGYGFMLNETRLLELAEPVPELYRGLFKNDSIEYDSEIVL